MAYIRTYAGHEQEGFYDILTGRPRYPFSVYNIVRQDRVDSRKARYSGKKPGGLRSPYVKPEGKAFVVPNYKDFVKRAKKL